MPHRLPHPARRLAAGIQALLCPLALLAAATTARADVVVTASDTRIVGATAQLRAGDRLQRVLAPAPRALEGCADWLSAEVEGLTGPRVIEGEREGRSRRWTLSPGSERTTVAVARADADGAACLAKSAVVRGDAAAAIAALPADGAAMLSPPAQTAVAEVFLATDRPGDALTILDGLLSRKALPGPVWQAYLHSAKALALTNLQRYADAETAAHSAVDEAQAAAPDSELAMRALLELARAGEGLAARPAGQRAVALATALCSSCRLRSDALYVYARLQMETDERLGALDSAKESLAILERLPGATPRDLSKRLQLLATMAMRAADTALSLDASTRAYALLEHSQAPAQERANAALALSNALFDRERWREALDYAQRAVALMQQAKSPNLGRARNNVARLWENLGYLGKAREEYDRALAFMRDHEAPDNLERARVEANLGRIAYLMGDDDSSAAHFDAAIATQQRVNPEGEDLASSLRQLGAVRVAQGRTDEAQALLRRALATYAKRPKDCLCVAPTLLDLGWLELARNDAAAAREHFVAAAAIFQREAGENGVRESQAQLGISQSFLAQDQAATALSWADRAYATLKRRAPAHLDLATVLQARAQAQARLGNATAAADDVCAATRVLDGVGHDLRSNSLAQSVFRSRHADVFLDCIRAELARGDPAAAFAALERSRARGLLDAIASHAAPAPAPKGGTAGLRVGEGARLSELPDGTLLLEYAVGERETLLFVGDRTAAQPEVLHLPVGRADLSARIAQWRARIERHDPRELAPLKDESARLHALLLGAVQTRLGRARALLISPDGPLAELPFLALWDPSEQRYLGERLPVGLIDSLSAWSRGAATRRGQRHVAVAMGEVPAAFAALGLPSLPAAQTEAEHVARQFPGRSTVLADAEATESAVRSALADAQTAHFAVHAVVDAQDGFDSALLLQPATAIADDDGRLTVREVLEGMTVPASLVVLSACDTARGTDLRGEGVLGFVRAFRYAGAGDVVASQWSVADRSTATWMDRFYAALDEGASPEAAARAAVAAFVRGDAPSRTEAVRGTAGLSRGGPSLSLAHPYYWASFQVYAVKAAASP